MIRSVLLWLTLCVASSSVGAEPFIVFEGKDAAVYSSKSTDHGETWSTNVLVYRSPGGRICECCHPSILASDDAVQVLFRNLLEGDRDMYLVTSRDQGATFGAAVRLGRPNWQLNACPMDGGSCLLLAQGSRSFGQDVISLCSLGGYWNARLSKSYICNRGLQSASVLIFTFKITGKHRFTLHPITTEPHGATPGFVTDALEHALVLEDGRRCRSWGKVSCKSRTST